MLQVSVFLKKYREKQHLQLSFWFMFHYKRGQVVALLFCLFLRAGMDIMKSMKKWIVFISLICVMMLAGCAQSASRKAGAEDETETKEKLITIGFSQVGAESDWRKENSESMRQTFTKEKGYELIFEDAQQKQQNQITAIRTFIQREVDYIVLAPGRGKGCRDTRYHRGPHGKCQR